MNIRCANCFAIIRFEGPIARTGSKVKCYNCGSFFTICPSKTVISDFGTYVINNSSILTRTCSIILKNTPQVDVFLGSSKQDFLKFKNCGLKTTRELMQFQDELRKEPGCGRRPE